MAILTPNWMQGGVYPARLDRQLIQRAFGNRELVFDGFVLTQNGAGNVSVNVSAGSCTVMGDDQTDQGMYLVVMDALLNVAMPAVPGADKRIDLLVVKINDPQAGGPAGNNATINVVQGVVAAAPVAPAAPASALIIGQVLRTAGDAAVLTAQLTDLAPRGIWPYTVSTASVPAKLPPNYLYIKVA